ncbi:hypothetical protein [Halomonas shantousis]
MASKTSITTIVLATLAFGSLGLAASELTWPLAASMLPWLGLYAVALVIVMALLILLVGLAQGLAAQQRALHASLENQMRQQRTMEMAQLMERFVHQAESLLDKDSLDPNKRSVLRCLAIDALRGNTGRGDPNYTRLARLFEWLADEAGQARDDTARLRIATPVLRQYAEIAEQLCQVGESDHQRLAPFLAHQPRSEDRDIPVAP